jgi:hypothetical protein
VLLTAGSTLPSPVPSIAHVCGREMSGRCDAAIAGGDPAARVQDRQPACLGRSELDMLRREADRFILIKAHAAVLLRWRGHDVPVR